jgi:N-methylhydantoinase B/oxoprolinase/acetone carboxylase alpha subunit
VTDLQTVPMSGAELAVLTARFEGVARKMANTLHRTGRSGILTIARDFSCIVLTAQHELANPCSARTGGHVPDNDAESSNAATRRRFSAQLTVPRVHPSRRS